jgi:hypothetical protein
MRRTLIAIAILVTGFGADAPRAEIVDLAEVKLSQHDQKQIQELACIEPHGVNANVIRAHRAKWQRTISIRVECKPHSNEQGLPVGYFTNCDNNAGIWSCESGHAALEIESPIGEILLEPNSTVDTKLSLEILRFALTQKTFQGIQILPALSEAILNVWTIRSLSADSWQISGYLFEMTISRDCRESKCAFRMTNFSVEIA